MSLVIAVLVTIILTIASIVSLVFWSPKEKRLWKTGTPKEKILTAIILILWLASFGIGASSTEIFPLPLIVSVAALSILYFYRRKRKEI